MEQRDLDDLIRRARARDTLALDALFAAFHPRVFGLLFRLTGTRETAEDLLQETFLRVVRTIDSYVHDGRFEAWLFRIAANLARDHSRQRKRRGATVTLDAETDDGGALADSIAAMRDPAPSAALTGAEDAERLSAALAELPAADREILLLRHFSELSFREIAEMLAIPLGTALARAHRALGKLREMLHDGDDVVRKVDRDSEFDGET